MRIETQSMYKLKDMSINFFHYFKMQYLSKNLQPKDKYKIIYKEIKIRITIYFLPSSNIKNNI